MTIDGRVGLGKKIWRIEMAAKIEKTCALIKNVIERETAKFLPED